MKMTQTTIRTYSELSKLETFLERFKYLQLGGSVGIETFGSERYINQAFYRSIEWKRLRDYVIARDNGCDLGVDGYEIRGKIVIHHMVPILPGDIQFTSEYLLNPEYLITTTHSTHNALHYGDDSLLTLPAVERKPNDTCPWKQQRLE